MQKLLFLFCICFIFSSTGWSQQLGLFSEEEHGSDKGWSPDTDPIPSEVTQWDATTNATNFFGRVVHGSVGDYLYIFSSQNATSLALAYHIPTKTWVTSTSPTAPGFNCASCTAAGKVYKMGGSGATTTFECFTPAGDGTGTWAVLTAGPSQVMGAENTIAWDGGNYIYASGANSSSPPVGYFHRYNITTNSWEQMASPPVGRRYSGMATIGRDIYRVGGLGDAGGDLTACYKYDTQTNTWSQIASFPEALNFTKWSLTTDGNLLYLVGAGGGFNPYAILTKVYVYDPALNTWSIESELPATRGLAVGTFLPSVRKLFFGGGNDGTSGTAYQVHCWEGSGGPYIPVELTSFTAEAVDQNIVLRWTTASETNNRMFEIENSANGKEWLSAGSVQGKGNSAETTEYEFVDNAPAQEVQYYRLKQIDFDGSITYSPVVNVQRITATEYLLNQNYPNPFNPATQITFNLPAGEQIKLWVSNLQGEEVAVLANGKYEAGTHTVQFSTGDYNLSSGVYIYTLRTNAGNFSRKLTVLK